MVKINALLNLGGQTLTALIAILTVSLYTSAFGVERYGIFLLLIAIQPYFGVADGAIGRITTNFVAQEADRNVLRATTWLGGASAMLFFLVFLVVYPLLSEQFGGDAVVRAEVQDARFLIAGLISFTSLLALQQAHFEGQHRFGLSNGLQLLGTILSTFIPLMPGLYDGSFDHLMLGVVAGRGLQFLVGMFFIDRRVLPRPSRDGIAALRRALPEMGWLASTGLLAITSATIDRVLLGFSYGPATLYYYAVPTSVATRLVLISTSVARGLAPIFARGEAKRTDELNILGSDTVILVISGIVLMVSAFGHDLLSLWISEDFAERSTILLRLALLSMLGLSMAQVPGLLLQSTGRTSLIVKLQLIEIVPYVLAVFVATKFGLTVVAMVLVTRNVLDGVAHMYLSGQKLSQISKVGAVMLVHVGALLAFELVDSTALSVRLPVILAVLVVSAGVLSALYFKALEQVWQLANQLLQLALRGARRRS